MTPAKCVAGKPASWWLWVAYWGFLFALTHVPVGDHVKLPGRFTDKVIHVGLYFGLTWLGGRHRHVSGAKVSTRALILWALAYAVFGVFDERLQSLVSRTTSLTDWLADLVGIALATSWLLFRARVRKLSEPLKSASDLPM